MLFLLVSTGANAQTSGVEFRGKTITSVDRFGNKNYEYNYRTNGKEVYSVDMFGNRKYDAPTIKIDNNKIYTVDKFGNRIHGE